MKTRFPTRTTATVFVASFVCCLWSGVPVTTSSDKPPTTVEAGTHFTNSILALVVSDGAKVYVVKGHDDRALEIAKQAMERTKANGNAKESKGIRINTYSSPKKLFRAVRKLPLLPNMTLYVTNGICAQRYNLYSNCTPINNGGKITWRKDVYNEQLECKYDIGSTNTCTETWRSNIGTSHIYLLEGRCTNGISHADMTDVLPGWVCSGANNQ